MPDRTRRDVLRDLIAKLEIVLEHTPDPADRERIEEEIRRLRRERDETPE